MSAGKDKVAANQGTGAIFLTIDADKSDGPVRVGPQWHSSSVIQAKNGFAGRYRLVLVARAKEYGCD
jgi:hypothetical protein